MSVTSLSVITSSPARPRKLVTGVGNSKLQFFLAGAAFLAVGQTAPLAHAAEINGNFIGTTDPGYIGGVDGTPEQATATVGAPGAASAVGDYWNNLSTNANYTPTTASTLVDSTNTTTAATVKWSVGFGNGSQWTLSAGGTAEDYRLFGGGIGDTTGAGTATLTFTNIPYSSYAIYVYLGSGADGHEGTVADNSVASGGTNTTYYFNSDVFVGGSTSSTFAGYSQVTSTTSSNYQSGDYAVFNETNDPNLVLSLNSVTASVGTEYFGFQIVQTPEPASLVAVACLGLLSRRRPRRGGPAAAASPDAADRCRIIESP